MQDLGLGVAEENSEESSRAQSKSIRAKELQYWRKRVTMEEEAAVKQAGMLLSLLSAFVESFTNAIGFKTIRTQGLSDAIQQALENGDFDLAIKSYCVSPQALDMLKNPMMSFMTSFGHVVLRTHIDNVKKELQQGINHFNRRKFTTREEPGPNPVPGTRTKDNREYATPQKRASFAFQSPPPPPIISPAIQQGISSIAPILNSVQGIITDSSDKKDQTEDSASPGLLHFK